MKKLLIFIILIFIVTGAFSQAPPPAPLDGINGPIGENLIFLLIVGVIYSLMELRKRFKEVNTHLKIK